MKLSISLLNSKNIVYVKKIRVYITSQSHSEIVYAYLEILYICFIQKIHVIAVPKRFSQRKDHIFFAYFYIYITC